MSYDPRQGSSPYLGMEVDEGQQTPVTGAAEPRTRHADAQERRTTRGAGRGSAARTSREGRQARPAATPRTRGTSRRSAAGVPQTVARPSGAPRRGVAPIARGNTSSMEPIRRRAVPAAPRADYYAEAPRPARRRSGPFNLLGSYALVMLAWVFRGLAIALSLLVVTSAILTDARRATLVGVLNLVTGLVPAGFAGHFVTETPFGGALRGDLIIASIILFCADWLCLVLSTSLREGRERGA